MPSSPSPEKKPYEPPSWESETVFETQALGCQRAPQAGGGKNRCLALTRS